MVTAPEGTITFLFTDIEGSTRLWEQYPSGMRGSLVRHDGIIRQSVEAHGGYVFKAVGDAFFAAFDTPIKAVNAALGIQRSLHAEKWGATGLLRVRIALDTGSAEHRNGDYFGLPLNRANRLIAAGHGGQVLLSAGTQQMVADSLPANVILRDLGMRRLKDIFNPERIFQLVAPDLPANFPPLRTLDQRPTNLPAPATSFLGREREVGEVCDALRRREVRLLVLTGPGGTGKTRLSLEVASSLLDEFEHGIFFIPLTPIRDPALVISTIAQAMEVPENSGRSAAERLANQLRDRHLLLVLDNFEQVVAAAPQVGDLLSAAPHLKILVTSRELLHLYGEVEFSVPPLSLPDLHHLPESLDALAAHAAIALFVERARTVRPDFALTAQNAQAVAGICARLDGLPLALELAAARIKILSPQIILDRLSSRLTVLTGGGSNLPPHQRTLRESINWSYDLLSDAEKTLFSHLSVFVGGWTVESAAEVIENASALTLLDDLASLLDKSLIRMEENREGEIRFYMLETIREYAQERLNGQPGGPAAVQQRHAAHFLRLAETAEPELVRSQQILWLDQLEREHDNLRAALEWSLVHEPETGLRLASALVRFWARRTHLQEGRRWIDRTLALTAVSTASRAQILLAASTLANESGDYNDSLGWLEEALPLWQMGSNKNALVRTMGNLAAVLTNLGYHEQAMNWREKSLAIAREIGDEQMIAMSLSALGMMARDHGYYDKALELHQEALSLFNRLGNRHGQAYAYICLARVALHQEKYRQAVDWCQQSIHLYAELGDQRNVAGTWKDLAFFALHEKDYQAAENAFRHCLLLYHDLQEWEGMSVIWEGLAGVAFGAGSPERATRLLGAAAALREARGYSRRLLRADQVLVEKLVLTIESQLGSNSFDAVFAEGKTMSIEQAMAYAAT
jgi:predicted ATPase/class 3 adenylate cyclase